MIKTDPTPKMPLERIADRFEAIGTEPRDRARLATAEAKRAGVERISSV